MKQEELQKIFLERLEQMCLMDDELFCAVFDGDIEVQRSTAGAAPRRARFNSSILDTNLLNKGTDFDKLPETYVIFITEHDVLKGGLPIYHIDFRINETGEEFDAGAHIIYVNGENRDESALGRLMQDFFAQDPNQMHDSILQRRAQHFKSDDMGVSKMSTIMQDIYDGARLEGIALGREEGRKIGREEGRSEGMKDMIRNMLRHNQTVEFIAQIADCPVEKVIEIAKAEGLIK